MGKQPLYNLIILFFINIGYTQTVDIKILQRDGSYIFQRDENNTRYIVFAPKCFTSKAQKNTWGPADTFNRKTLWNYRQRIAIYKKVLLEAVLETLIVKENVAVFSQLWQQTRLNTAQAKYPLDFVKRLPNLSKQTLSNRAKALLQKLKLLTNTSNYQAMQNAIAQAGKWAQIADWSIFDADMALQTLSINALNRDLALKKLNYLQNSFSKHIDPALGAAIIVAKEEMTTDPDFWETMVKVTWEKRIKIGKKVAQEAVIYLSKKVATSSAIKGSLISIWAIPVAIGIAELKAIVKLEKEHQQAILMAALAKELKKLKDSQLNRTFAYAQFSYTHHMYLSLDGWLKMVGMIWPDIHDLYRHYKKIKQQSWKILEQTLEIEPDNIAHSALAMTLIIDCSGSMKGQKIIRVRQACQMLLQLLRPQDKIALISFGSRAKIIFPLTTLSFQRENLIKQIHSLQAKGGTNFIFPLKYALKVLPYSLKNKVILFLSDGRATYPKSQIQTCKAFSIPIYTVAFGKDAHKHILYQMAKQTQGQMFLANKFNLSQVFNLVAVRAKGHSEMLVKRGVIHPWETLWTSLQLYESAPFLEVALTWPGSELKLVAITPKGKEIHASFQAAKQQERVPARFLRIANAQAGNWRIKVQALDVPVAGEPYTLTANCATTISTGLIPTRPVYQPQDKVVLAVAVDKKLPLPQVRATIKSPMGKHQVYHLNDKGKNGDTTAGDGIFSLALSKQTNVGFYHATFLITGKAARKRQQKDQASFQRKIQLTYQIGNEHKIIPKKPVRKPIAKSHGGIIPLHRENKNWLWSILVLVIMGNISLIVVWILLKKKRKPFVCA